MATSTAPKEENSTTTSNDASPAPQLPPLLTAATDSSPKEIDEPKSLGDSPTTGDAAADPTMAVKDNGANNDDVTVSDTEKKMRRAERFGVPVQISEEEKRNTRAERFGTGSGSESGVHGSDALTKSEEQKRKARGERFGSVQSVSADEEAKKKARLSRFTAVALIDPLEEEKKKARALRFSKAPSGSPSQVNGKANDIETKTAITGKAGGET
ncbi:protein MODIFIER OF SNC1 11 [Rhododendron vialii]|uniref:protein MODIFIER OF SNC1 11 n=1 Tax=Rhododendron vialii TaxID=182163 RepID=UPI00265E1221|nr:protein MODIFIER OF SNC1 11 [Rhododendron vialii]